MEKELEECAAKHSEAEVDLLEAAASKGVVLSTGGVQANTVATIVLKARELGKLKAKLLVARSDFRKEERLLAEAEKAAERILGSVEKARVRIKLCEASQASLMEGWR